MRISTSQFQRTSLSSILERQTKLAKLQQQLGSGRRILTPADDPAGCPRRAQSVQGSGSMPAANRGSVTLSPFAQAAEGEAPKRCFR